MIPALDTVLAGSVADESLAALDVVAIDRCLAAIDRSGAKVMYTDRDGEHAEWHLPPGESGAHIPATKCYMDLDRCDAPLGSTLLPARLRGLKVLRVNAYVSPAGEGVALHFDSRHVVIVQLAGAKHWEHAATPAVRDPPSSCVAPSRGGAVAFGDGIVWLPTDLISRTLRPGDWLLIPAGTWHRTNATEYSLSATLAVSGPYGR
jgi:hypothetical protein